MEIDQLIFKHLVRFFSKDEKKNPNPGEVHLGDMHARLSLIVRALSGESIDILASEREGGWSDLHFFLPKTIGWFDSREKNESLYMFRVFYLSVQRELDLNWKSHQNFTIPQSQAKAKESSDTVLEKLFEDYPNSEDMYALLLQHCPTIKPPKGPECRDESWIYGRYMRNTETYYRKKLENISQPFLDEKSPPPPVGDQTEIEAKSADEVEILQVDKKAQEDFMLTHNFEKVDTVDEFNGVWRDFDGDDELKEQAEAIQEYNLSQLVRIDDPVHSIYKADFRGDSNIAQSSEQEKQALAIYYPEWDFKKREYKRDFCKLYHQKILKKKPDYYANTLEQNAQTLKELQKTFARFNNKLEYRPRQLHGDEIDLDAFIDLYTDVVAKRTPDERCYIYRKKAQKELSLLILLDLSLSSDGYVYGNRILDVEKQVSILFGEVLNAYNIDFQIDGFSSKTRNHITYSSLKSFDQKWDDGKLRIGAIQAEGYTRIGPAIRHAKTQIEKRTSARKWIIILSDGKPNDYDHYEGKYGMEDIKQSIRELRSDGIQSFALAIEEQAKYYLPQIFGKNHFSILSSPNEMIITLTQLYHRILTGG